MREFVAFDMENTAVLSSLFDDRIFSERFVRRVGESELHLTFNFMGEVDPALNQRIAEEIDAVAGATGSYEVEFRGVGVFPSPARPSVIWIGVVDRGETERIYAALSERFGRLGLRTESRAFHPHITVGRVKGRIERAGIERLLANWKEHSFGRQRISELILKKSELTPDGAIHTTLHVSGLRR